MKAEDVFQSGAIEFVRRFKVGVEVQPENWRFQIAKCACIDAAKALGQGYWVRADKKTPDPEIVAIDAYVEIIPDPQLQTKDRDDRLDNAWQIIEATGDVKLIKAFELLLEGNTQREAAAQVKISTSRLSEKLADIGEIISGKRRARRSINTARETTTALTLNISAYFTNTGKTAGG